MQLLTLLVSFFVGERKMKNVIDRKKNKENISIVIFYTALTMAVYVFVIGMYVSTMETENIEKLGVFVSVEI